MELGLKGRIALVTGAGSQRGIGKGIALAMAREGCDLIISDIDKPGLETTAADIKTLGRRVLPVKVDVTNPVEVNMAVDQAIAEFGRIDILVNNAGGSTPPQLFAETNYEKWQKDIALNLNGVLNCTRAVVPYMVKQRRGDIISMSSEGGVMGVPTGTIYGAVKAGVIAFTKGLAQELIDSGIRVNCIAPAFVFTNFYEKFPAEWQDRGKTMSSAGKSITPEEIGNLVAYLVSDISLHITGQCIQVTGTNSPRP